MWFGSPEGSLILANRLCGQKQTVDKRSSLGMNRLRRRLIDRWCFSLYWWVCMARGKEMAKEKEQKHKLNSRSWKGSRNWTTRTISSFLGCYFNSLETPQDHCGTFRAAPQLRASVELDHRKRGPESLRKNHR